MELEQLFADVVLCVIPSCNVEDFNITYDDECERRPLRQLLNYFNLLQHVHEATHSVGHTFDFVISHCNDNRTTTAQVAPTSTSDHHIVRCVNDVSRPPKTSAEIQK